MRTTMVTCKGTKGGRRIRWTERCQTHFRSWFTHGISRDHQPVHVGQFALIGCHTVGGVTLDVLNGAHSFTHGQSDILGGHIVLVVDESLGFCRTAIGGQFDVCHPPAVTIVRHRKCFYVALESSSTGRVDARLRAIIQYVADAPQTPTRTGDVARFGLFAGQENLGVLIPVQAAFGM